MLVCTVCDLLELLLRLINFYSTFSDLKREKTTYIIINCICQCRSTVHCNRTLRYFVQMKNDIAQKVKETKRKNKKPEKYKIYISLFGKCEHI